VAEDYFCHLGPDGRRRDVHDRPELCCGSVEFAASSEYMVRRALDAVVVRQCRIECWHPAGIPVVPVSANPTVPHKRCPFERTVSVSVFRRFGSRWPQPTFFSLTSLTWRSQAARLLRRAPRWPAFWMICQVRCQLSL
jgi:hypothetical protein